MNNQQGRLVLDAALAHLTHLDTVSGSFVLAVQAHPIHSSISQGDTPKAPGRIAEVERKNLPSRSSHRIALPPFQRPSDMFSDGSDFTSAQTLDELYERIHTCTKCPLGATRTKFVFGTGSPNAEIVFIGEAPGADEDLQGEPFVGRAGQLLTKILAAIGFSRQDVYICNILKCRPPNNRKPLPSEVEQCEPYLYKQLALINPVFIVALGATAAETLLRRKIKMMEARGQWYDFYGARLLVTYHPAALLRNPELKRDTWVDVQRLRSAYDAYRSSGILPEPTVHSA
ncbi:MAG: uracil-DNA glycosylase [Chlorobi bacterium]|nr:uracil-DNA glycosylase [Chlorobiota bacterium]